MRPYVPKLICAALVVIGCTPTNMVGDAAPSLEDRPADSPKALLDGSTPPTDGSAPPADGSAPPADGSAPPTDGSTPPTDGSTPPTDGSTPPTDGSTPPTDGSTPPTDGSTPPTDGSAPPTDGSTPPMRDLSMPGPHRVAVWTGPIAGTQGDARVFYPMTTGSERYPLVVFAHGFQLNVGNYNTLLTHVASWGYVVASVSYPGSILMVDHRNVPAALSAARRAFATGSPPGVPAAVRADASRAVAMGHSLGGKGAIMAVLADGEFDACLALDPVDDNPSPLGRITEATPSIAPERMGELRRPLGLFGATQSRCASLGQTCAPESSDYRRFAAAAPSSVPVTVWALRDFGHMNFVDPGCGIACLACASGSTPLDSRLAALRLLTVAFLERYTRNDATMQTWLDGPGRASLTASGVLWNGAASTLPPCR